MPLPIQLTPFQKTLPFQIQMRASVWIQDDDLCLVYDIDHPDGRIQWPAVKINPERSDGLWNQTCLELFIANASNPEYWEYNFSPNGDWNCYHFDDYRTTQKQVLEVVRCEVAALDSLEGNTSGYRIAVTTQLPAILDWTTDIQVNLAAIVCIQDERYHFALTHHRSDRPDFHHRRCFIHTLIR